MKKSKKKKIHVLFILNCELVYILVVNYATSPFQTRSPQPYPHLDWSQDGWDDDELVQYGHVEKEQDC
jgi:hypothetical protein